MSQNQLASTSFIPSRNRDGHTGSGMDARALAGELSVDDRGSRPCAYGKVPAHQKLLCLMTTTDQPIDERTAHSGHGISQTQRAR